MSTPRRKKSQGSAGAIERALGAVATALEASARPGMIIGGIAVIARGVTRLTKDIDATVAGGGTDLDALVAELAPYGITPRIADAVRFARESHVLLLRHVPSGVDVDLTLAWLPFELDAIAAAEVASVHGTRIRVPKVEDLVIYKIVGWRPQDQQDVERLVALHGGHIDLDRVRRLAGEVATALEDPERAEEVERLLVRATSSDAPRLRRSLDQGGKHEDSRPVAKKTRKK